MDQSNVTTRQQKKNGKGKATEQPTEPTIEPTAESTSSSGDKPMAQSAYLAGFSAEQAQSLTTFMSGAINNAVEPMNKEMTDLISNVTRLQTAIEKMLLFQASNGEKTAPQASSTPIFPMDPRTSKHMAAESTSSAGERPTAKGGFLADFSAGTPRPPSHIKFESQQPDQRNEPNFGGIPTQSDLQSRIQIQR